MARGEAANLRCISLARKTVINSISSPTKRTNTAPNARTLRKLKAPWTPIDLMAATSIRFGFAQAGDQFPNLPGVLYVGVDVVAQQLFKLWLAVEFVLDAQKGA